MFDFLKEETKKEQPNPFIPDVMRLLKESPDELKIYDVLSGLDQELLAKVADTDDYNLTTFRKNFWMMNAVYKLQAQLLSEENLYLSIGQVSISITPGGAASHSYLSDNSEHKLRDYYLDWANYHSTFEDDVDQLLEQFWKRFYSDDKVEDAFELLGVDDESDWNAIQAAYRKLARAHHPDHGGDSAKFIAVREAYEVLQVRFQS